jgi:hypothetical protein
MNRRNVLVGLGVVFAAVLTTTIVRCDFPLTASTSFSYIPHEAPRVFVSHHPIRALPGQSVTIRLAPNLRTEDDAVVRAVAGLRRVSATREEQTCSSQSDGTFTCTFTLPAGEADFIYDGHLELVSGARVNSRASYLFTATSAFGSNRLITLREPVVEVRDLQPTYRMDTAWIRDPTRNPTTGAEQYAEGQFTADIETGIYEGILQDPVYRWRDDQLGFYVYSDPGFTSLYYSGFDTRCGQNPWPSETAFRSALSNIETIGVLHRYSDVSGLEGTVTSNPPPTARTIRDCAGDAVKRAGLGTFAVTGGSTQTALIAKHEFGHAAFGLGDEYPESNATRSVAAAPAPPPTTCCCVVEAGSGTSPGTTIPGGTGTSGTTSPGVTTVPGTGGGLTVPGGDRAVLCMSPGGSVGPAVGGSTLGLPTCSSPPAFPIQCGATPQAACPTLSGNCVELQMWLGPTPPTTLDTARPNVFPSQSACEAGRARALIHPGVEDRDRSLGVCHELCGPSTNPCPCGQPEAWIVDTNPHVASAPAMTRPDSMASVTAERHGGTCAWCVETSLCVRWQRARGNTVEAAWNHCNAPPENAAELERQSVTLARAIFEWLRALTKDWHF